MSKQVIEKIIEKCNQNNLYKNKEDEEYSIENDIMYYIDDVKDKEIIAIIIDNILYTLCDEDGTEPHYRIIDDIIKDKENTYVIKNIENTIFEHLLY